MSSSFGLSGFPRLSAAQAEARAGRDDAASALVIAHLREHPGEPRGLALLGSIALQSGALVQSEQFLREAMARGATGFDVQRDLAASLHQQERLDEALAAYSHFADRMPDPRLRATKASILDKLGRTEAALVEHRVLVKEHPDCAPFWIGYGHSLRAMGDLNGAVAAYRRSIDADPEYGEAWWALASIKNRLFTDADIAVMKGLIETAVDLINIIPLHFALGRALHDRTESAEAFAHFSKGNALRAGTINYDWRELASEVDDFIARFGADHLAVTTTGSPPIGGIPVFLVSMPRAGSTLLEQMLDRHSMIEAVGELPYARALVRSAMEIHTRVGPLKVADLVARLGPDEGAAYGADYLARAALHRRKDVPYFIDKMPMNWSDIPFIRKILPHARFIDIRRGGMDCCFSNYVHYFSRAHASSFRLDDIGRCYVDYVRFMDHIVRVAPGLVHKVDYARLVTNPETELNAALTYLRLDWEPSLLSFHESGRAVRTPSAEQVRRPLNREGLGAWRAYKQWLGPLSDALGPLA